MEGGLVGETEAHWARTVAEVLHGGPFRCSQFGSVQASGEKDAAQRRSQWVMLFLEGSMSCSRAGFLCPSEYLLGKIRAQSSMADEN